MYGDADETGRSPIAGKPIKPEDLNATIAYALGLPLNDVQYSFRAPLPSHTKVSLLMYLPEGLA